MSADSNHGGESDRPAPGGALHDNLEVDAENPNIVRAIPATQRAGDETAGNTSPGTRAEDDGYGDIIEGSDSERTGTSWGLPGREPGQTQTSAGEVPEGEGDGEAHPNRNTGDRVTRDELDNVGSWSTIDTDDSAGSPSGFS
ncbi:MAG TPA: hypothetical protein VFH60_11020 [Chloroflexia bacterium]|nr:hypothetical protein [Chloroflexia bacterium]